MTRFPVCALRSVEIDTPDLAKSEAFYTGPWALEVAARSESSVWLRATGDDHHVLVLHQSDRAAFRCVVFRAAEGFDLETVADLAEAHGSTIISPAAPDDGPAGGTMLALRSPDGLEIRVVHGDHRHADAASVANRVLRLAHININTKDVDATAKYFESVFGFQLTDRSAIMAFVRCNDDHHAVVIAEAKLFGLNHIAFLMPELESLMRGAGRVVGAGTPIGWGIGRHGPGDNVFAYFVDPLGFVVEYTAEVLQVDDDYQVRGPADWAWPPGRIDHWGIAPPKPDYVKAAQLAIPYA
jgi:catechol 2,3-dioxygenase